MAATFGWERYTGIKGRNIGMHRFGASAPMKDLLKYFGFTVDHVVAEAHAVLARDKLLPFVHETSSNRQGGLMQPTGVLDKAKATKNPLQAIAGLRPVDVARLHPSRPVHQRQAEADDRRGRIAGHDLESRDLRESHRRQLFYDDMLKSLASRKDLDATGAFRADSRFATFRMLRTSSALSTTNPTSATATSAWKFRLISPAKRKTPWMKRGGCGRQSIARTS